LALWLLCSERLRAEEAEEVRDCKPTDLTVLRVSSEVRRENEEKVEEVCLEAGRLLCCWEEALVVSPPQECCEEEEDDDEEDEEEEEEEDEEDEEEEVSKPTKKKTAKKKGTK